MKRLILTSLIPLSLGILLEPGSIPSQESALGVFEEHGDNGAAGRPGSLEYDAARKSCLVAGGGENMWSISDACHFVWKLTPGDISLAAYIRWMGNVGNPHRKACLLIRQSLDPGSPYTDAVVHGDGLASLQFGRRLWL